jgi:integrase/recombinase XerD
MIQEKGLSQHTVRIHCWHVEQFLNRFWEQHPSFDEVAIADIDAAVTRKGDRDGYARTSIQSYINSLRAFFRYAEQRGWCRPGLAAAIMSVHLFADEGLPKGPSWGDDAASPCQHKKRSSQRHPGSRHHHVVRHLRDAGR